MIYMGGQTVVDEISDGTGSSIPLHSFEFVDFGNVPSRNRDNSLFTGRCFGELILHLQLVFASCHVGQAVHTPGPPHRSSSGGCRSSLVGWLVARQGLDFGISFLVDGGKTFI